MKDNVRNIAASVKARLMSKAKETNRPFAEVLQYFGMERFLYRLSRSKYSEKFILKGALMFTVWQIPERRTTLDIDFLARYDNQIDSIENAMKDICEISIESDGIVFDLSTVKGTRIKADADYEGVRIKLIGFLEQSRIPLQIDIGFGDVVYPNPKTIDYPVVLDFPKPHLKGYPAENTISEKIELPAKKPLFAEEIYDHGSDRQKLWKAFIVKEESKIAPEHLSSVAKEIEDFLILPVKAIAKTKEFNKHWKAPGPWK